MFLIKNLVKMEDFYNFVIILSQRKIFCQQRENGEIRIESIHGKSGTRKYFYIFEKKIRNDAMSVRAVLLVRCRIREIFVTLNA